MVSAKCWTCAVWVSTICVCINVKCCVNLHFFLIYFLLLVCKSVSVAIKIVKKELSQNCQLLKFNIVSRAVINEPKLLILDEPFTGLDPINVGLLKAAVKDLQKNGCSIIFSSHQMEYIEDFCEELIILVHGKAVINGNLRFLFSIYNCPKVLL